MARFMEMLPYPALPTATLPITSLRATPTQHSHGLRPRVRVRMRVHARVHGEARWWGFSHAAPDTVHHPSSSRNGHSVARHPAYSLRVLGQPYNPWWSPDLTRAARSPDRGRTGGASNWRDTKTSRACPLRRRRAPRTAPSTTPTPALRSPTAWRRRLATTTDNAV